MIVPAIRRLQFFLVFAITVSACITVPKQPISTTVSGLYTQGFQEYPKPTREPTNPGPALPSTPPEIPSAAAATTETPIQAPPKEASVQIIPVAGELSQPDAEISGMAWYGDLLLMLPQYPERYPSQSSTSSLFAATKSEILGYLDGRVSGSIKASRIPIYNANFVEDIPGYEGFEAIAINNDQVMLSIEANDGGVMRGFLIQGQIQVDGSSIKLDPGSLVEIPVPIQLFNASYETLVFSHGNALAFFEANGRDINPEPRVAVSDLDLEAFMQVSLNNIEYRITDATDIDSEGYFWVLNIFMPIEFWFYTNSDPLTIQYGRGETHRDNYHVERLLEFKYNDGQITLSKKPPLYLELIDDVNARNWEALVRLDDHGFLAMTDTYPETILAYIPFPDYQ